jgi:hypothetical protein
MNPSVMKTRYYKDDARIKAVSTLDTNKIWSQIPIEEKMGALKKYLEICSSWYEMHTEYANSDKGKKDLLEKLRLAFAQLRKIIKAEKSGKTIQYCI